MKQKVLLSALLCIVFAAPSAFGQRVKVNSQSAVGTFNVSASSAQQVEARYAIRPAGPDNIVLMIAPKAAFTLNAHIIDSRGREVAKIPAEAVTLRYANSIDISKLAPGNYFIEVLSGGANNYSIPFTVDSKNVSTQAKTVQAKQ